jgi:hypothetical protein
MNLALSGSSRRKEAHSIPTRSSEKRSEPRDLGCYVRLMGSWPQCRLLVLLLFLVLSLDAWTQYPTPPPPMTGPTVGASLRNAATATQTQAALVRKAAYDWGRRAVWSTYQVQQFQNDFNNMQLQFQSLRTQFNWVASYAAQTGRPQASNAVAELDAGLNVIAELFTFLQGQFNAGTLDRNTIVRTCRAFEEAMRQWERELKKNDARLSLIW